MIRAAVCLILGFALAYLVWFLRPRLRRDPGRIGRTERGGVLWYVPDCGYIHAGEPGWTIPAHCPDGVAHWAVNSLSWTGTSDTRGTTIRDSAQGFGEAGW